MYPTELHHDLIKQLVNVFEKMEMTTLLYFDCKMSLVSLNVQNTVNECIQQHNIYNESITS